MFSPDSVKNGVDNIIDGIDYAFRSLSDLCFGSSPRELIDLQTVDSSHTLLTKDGSLFSVVEILGCPSVVGQEEFADRVEDLTEIFRTRLGLNSGHYVKFIFESDPDDIVDELSSRLSGARLQAKKMGLDLDDIIDEKIDVNAQFCRREKLWMVFYTTLGVLNRSEQSNAKKDLSETKKSYPRSGNAQDLLKYYDATRKTHIASVEALCESIDKAGLGYSILSSDAVLANSVSIMHGPNVAKSWQPDTIAHGVNKNIRELRNQSLKTDKFSSIHFSNFKRYLQNTSRENNESLEPFSPRTLGEQILTDDIQVKGNYVLTKDKIYAPIHVTRHAQSPSDFDRLIRSMKSTPFRVSFTITPDGLSSDYFNSLVTSAFSWVSQTNRQINKARTQLSDYQEVNGTVVGLSIVATTWANIDQKLSDSSPDPIIDTQEIDGRLNKLIASFTDWGSSHAAATTPDPAEAVLSTVPGLIGSHVSSITPAPFFDVATMLPISRPQIAWNKGAILYRTDDGTPMSYEQFSSAQKAWITLVMGTMGSGKSSQMNSLNLGFLIQAAESGDLPYLRGIDFGYSGKGVVDIVHSALPEGQKNRAAYVRLKNDIKYSTNVFDTPRGSRSPLPNHILFLSNFLQSVAHSMRAYPNLEGLCNLCIAEAYKRYTDDNFNTSAKAYSKGTNIEVDLAIDKHQLNIEDGKSSWWAVVDALFDVGEIHVSGLAQRYAVPTLEDIVGIATSPNVKAEYGENLNGHPVTELFARSVREAIDSLPFLRSVTKFDISDSEILILDLAEMIPAGAALSEQQKVRAAIIFLVSMRLLSADYFMDEDYLPFFHPKYRTYHSQRLKRLTTLKKRFFVDERHRIKGVDAAEAQTDQMIVEGRKFFVDVMQGSQEFDDFSKKVQNQSTTIIFCGTGSREATDKLAVHYGLNSTQKKIINGLRGPEPGKGAAALFKFNTKARGDQFLHLYNTEGPLMLCAIATEAPDRYVRGQLYKLCRSTKIARQVFAKAFPNGSVKAELKRRSDLMEDDLYVSKTGHISDDIVDELLQMSQDWQ